MEEIVDTDLQQDFIKRDRTLECFEENIVPEILNEEEITKKFFSKNY